MSAKPLAAAVLLCLAAVAPAAAETSSAGEKAMLAAGRIMYDQRCHICHSNHADTRSYGPTLVGVIGRKAGSVPDFAYSEAMKSSGITWTEQSVRAWMANNTGMMPGTRMRHVGVTDTAEQDFIVAYLKSLKD